MKENLAFNLNLVSELAPLHTGNVVALKNAAMVGAVQAPPRARKLPVSKFDCEKDDSAFNLNLMIFLSFFHSPTPRVSTSGRTLCPGASW